MALTPNLAAGGSSGGGIVIDDDNNNDINDLNDNDTSGRGSGSHDEADLDGYDSEKCPTPELSSPLRSTNISARDLQVLTPSISRADYNSNSNGNTGNNGSYRRDIGGGSGDESDACPTPELSSPLRSAGSAALCRRRLEEAGDDDAEGEEEEEEPAAGGGALELVSEEEYAKVSYVCGASSGQPMGPRVG